MKTMNITILEGVVINGKDYFEGDVEVDVSTAVRLISSKKAKVSETQAEKVAPKGKGSK
jgi:hypothetical protein